MSSTGAVHFLALGLCDPWRPPEQGQPESSHACTLHLIVTVESSGKQLDAERVQFGVRSILFDMDKGFFLESRVSCVDSQGAG
jgi:hypothetical protein